jgi:dihydrolipoamide dehydrogenase
MHDIVIIGAGPGGYVCALRAAQLGLQVAIVDKAEALGGTCLNVGCIPSKALLHSTELYHALSHGADHGIVADKLRVDVAKLMARKDKVVRQLRDGVRTLIDKRGVERVHGTARLAGPGKVEVALAVGGSRVLETRNVVIATGSQPVALPFLPFDGQRVVSSDHAIAFEAVPESLIVVGGGAIGLELGSVWARLGSKVTVIEFLPVIAAGSDEDVSKLAERIFKKQGLAIETNTKVIGAEVGAAAVTLTVEKGGKQKTLTAERVLVAVGRKPYTDGLGLDSVGLAPDAKGRIPVDQLRTAAAGVWAIGDVVDGPMLAHKAEEDGVAVAEWIAGHHPHVDYRLVPNVIYTHPEIASVGLTERALKESGRAYRVGKFGLAANGRAIAQDATDGFVKILADATTDALLGASVISAGASEMIASIVGHMTYGGSAEDLGRTIHAHPTISEAIKEAALAVSGSAIHAL